MKRISLCLATFCIIFCSINSGNAQKEVDRIYDLYQLEAYHLTIKKINNLKLKRHSRSDLQMVLADCYWKIGDEDRSAQLYKKVSVVLDIPDAFKERCCEASNSEINENVEIQITALRLEPFAIPELPIAKSNRISVPIQNSKTIKTKIELIPKRAIVNSIVDKPLHLSSATSYVFERLNKQPLIPFEFTPFEMNDTKVKTAIIKFSYLPLPGNIELE